MQEETVWSHGRAKSRERRRNCKFENLKFQMKADADPSTALGMTDFDLRGAVKRERRRPEAGGGKARTKATASARDSPSGIPNEATFFGYGCPSFVRVKSRDLQGKRRWACS